MFTIRLLAVLLILGCTACASPRMQIDILSSDFESYTVILVPNVETKKLDIISDPQGDQKVGKQKGWVGFARGKNGTITFTLDALPSRPACTEVAATTAAWVISKIELSKNGNPQTQKGSGFGSSQTGWISTAFPQMNSNNGEIQDDNIGTIATVVQNLNNNSGAMMAYYQVTAKRCSDGLELTTDPVIGNGGK